MTRVFERPTHAATLHALGLAPPAERLATLNPLLASAFVVTATFEAEEAEAARIAAGERTRHVILQVLAAYAPWDPTQAARRDAVLAELRSVEQRVARRRAHRPATAAG